MKNKGYQRVLFCVPPLSESAARGYSYQNVPRNPITGIGYLSEFLSNHGIENDTIDLRLYYNGSLQALLPLLHKRINRTKPDLLAFQVMTFRRDLAYALIEQLKSPDYDILIGGHHVSTVRTEAINEADADFAIKLEGEYPLLELCQGKDLDKIEGLIYRDGEEIIENDDRPFITDLDNIPFPRYEKFELDKYSWKDIPIVTSRGCPYSCNYCPIHATIGKLFRYRSAENVAEEVRYWHERGYREMSFVDDNFTLRMERVYKICDLIEGYNLEGLRLSCPNGVRADRVDRDLLQRMRDVGFYRLCFGVEVGNNRMLKLIKKGVTMDKIEQAIKDACDLDYDVVLFFMVGSLGETAADVGDSLKLAMKYPVASANFYNVIPFPETELFKWVKENNYFVGTWYERLNYGAHHDDTPFFETPEFPLEERKAMLRRGEQVNVLIRKRALLKGASKLGFLGRLIAGIIYSDYFYPRVIRLYNGNRLVQRLVNKIIQVFGLKIYHL